MMEIAGSAARCFLSLVRCTSIVLAENWSDLPQTSFKMAVLRRADANTASPMKDYTIGQLVFEPDNYLLRWEGGSVMLTDKESSILKILARHEGRQ